MSQNLFESRPWKLVKLLENPRSNVKLMLIYIDISCTPQKKNLIRAIKQKKIFFNLKHYY